MKRPGCPPCHWVLPFEPSKIEFMLGMATRLILALVLVVGGLLAQARPETPPSDIQERYTKYEYRIPMRDGVHLFTAVYVPKDS